MITVDKSMLCDLMAAMQHQLQLDTADSLIRSVFAKSDFLPQSDFRTQSGSILRSDSLAQDDSIVWNRQLHTILTCKQLVSHKFLA